MIDKKNIQFSSHGSTCRGWLFRPSQTENPPCIILAHGFCGVKEMRLDAYAERFARAGYCALVFDYRHFGASDGEPRQVLDIKKQHQDWHAAIACARALPIVDPQKIVTWGTSFSGGHVFAVAAKDRDIAAVISQVPHINGFATARTVGLVPNIRLGAAALRDLVNKVLGRSPHYVPAFGRPGDLAAMTAPGAYEASRKLYPNRGGFSENVAARIFLSLIRYSPGKFAAKLKVPHLIQVALKDKTTPPKPAIKAANRAPRGELIAYDVDHFDVYVQPDFEQTVTDQVNFLKKHIG